MCHALRTRRMELLPINIRRPPTLGIIPQRLHRTTREPQHSGPLLDLLLQVLRIERRIRRAVEDLHLWAETTVSRICRVDNGFPLRAGLDDLPGGAGGGPHIVPVPGEAAEGDAGPCRAGCEDVWVGTKQDVGHHRTGGSAHREDAVRVPVVLGQGPLDHADDALAVAAAVVGECLLG